MRRNTARRIDPSPPSTESPPAPPPASAGAAVRAQLVRDGVLRRPEPNAAPPPRAATTQRCLPLVGDYVPPPNALRLTREERDEFTAAQRDMAASERTSRAVRR